MGISQFEGFEDHVLVVKRWLTLPNIGEYKNPSNRTRSISKILQLALQDATGGQDLNQRTKISAQNLGPPQPLGPTKIDHPLT